MKTIEYKGYTISQAKNNHVMITKNNKMVFHSNSKKELTDDELREKIDWFIEFNWEVSDE